MEKKIIKKPIIKNFKCPIENVVKEKELSKYSNRQVWYKKRNHCLNKCKKCDTLEILKKIYWELRKPE